MILMNFITQSHVLLEKTKSEFLTYNNNNNNNLLPSHVHMFGLFLLMLLLAY